MSSLISEEQLKGWSGFEQRTALERWLRREKIKFTYGKGNKLITTQEAVNKALGIRSTDEPMEQDGFF